MSVDLVFVVDEAKIYIICKVTLTNCRRSEWKIIFHCLEKATTFLFPNDIFLLFHQTTA